MHPRDARPRRAGAVPPASHPAAPEAGRGARLHAFSCTVAARSPPAFSSALLFLRPLRACGNARMAYGPLLYMWVADGCDGSLPRTRCPRDAGGSILLERCAPHQNRAAAAAMPGGPLPQTLERMFRKNFTAAEQLLAAQPLCAQDKFDLLLCLRQLPTSVVREIVGYTAR